MTSGEGGAVIVNVEVRTVKAGRDYYARATDAGDRLVANYRLMLDVEAGMVVIYTADDNLGGWRLERFGGSLSPATIRGFFLRPEVTQ